ncbi:MAG: hypothetical protein NZ840_07685 [Anaerolineales bacterium]|nr:hypothetical protein [Anaerolineales bacterium]MDW8161920.1 hypothetical protein [Anaerolineales bacterium]
MSPNGGAERRLSPIRLSLFMVVVGTIFSLYTLRLFSLQILQVKDWVARAEENRVEVLNLPAMRGIIVDRNGIVLARNIPSFNVVITAANLPDDPGEVQEIYRQLSALIDVPVNLNQITPENPYVPCFSEHGIAQIAEYGRSSTPYQPVRVKCDIPEQIARIIQERSVDWPGVSVEIEPIRDYPTGSLTASIIGFLGPIPANQEEEYRDLCPIAIKLATPAWSCSFRISWQGKTGLGKSRSMWRARWFAV